jgi:two-component system chemotaxis sensor kinase CheA
LPAGPGTEAGSGGEVVSDCWHISLRFGAEVFRNGMDPLSFLRYLASLGELVHVELVPDALPEGDAMDPETCYLGFEIRLRSSADKARIEATFDFVRDDCQLRILAPQSRLDDYIALIHELPEDVRRVGEILLRCGALTAHELDQALALQAAAPIDAPRPRLGEVLVEQGMAEQPVVSAALEKQKHNEDRRAQDTKLIKVQADKLDRLIDLVGELVIAGAAAQLMAQRAGDPALGEAAAAVSALVEGIRDGALRLRMVQIGEIFGRFQRVVRDVSRELGKDIELLVTGADTELDKSMVEKLADPLMHLVRNAIDHGIEPAELRAQRGKSVRGTLRLAACHDSGSIVIEVADDGGGIDRARVLAKAVAQGLVDEGQTLPDHEILNLVMAPGFSTAAQVTNLSGRGVGMDVVKRNIEQLRGSIEIDSREGAGTTMRIRLPLTLAIIDGFLVRAGGRAYVLPLDSVVECVELPEQADMRGDYFGLRGEVLPYLRLRQLFEIEGVPPRRESVVVTSHAGQKIGVVVDELAGELQTVIKPLGRLFSKVRGLSGSTIIGSGEVALIVDVPALAQRAAQSPTTPRDTLVAVK